MRILVTVASRHGSTAELAAEIGKCLRDAGSGPVDPEREVDVELVDEVSSLDPYDAVILGSAIYVGRWLDEAAQFALRRSAELRQRPVWLFSSGPVGDVLGSADEDGVDIAAVRSATNAREHRVFAGKIDMLHLGYAEQAAVRGLRVPQGDDRDWAAVRDWAEHISADLAADGPR